MDEMQTPHQDREPLDWRTGALSTLAVVMVLAVLVFGVRTDWRFRQDGIDLAQVEQLINSGNSADALERLNGAIARGDAYPDAYAMRGDLYSSLRRFSAAILDYTEYLKTVKDPDVYSKRCNAYRMKAEFGKAVADCEASIKLAPDSANGYLNLALVYLDQKDLSLAEKDLDEAHALDGQSPEVYFAQFQLYTAQSRTYDALNALDGCLTADPNSIPCYWERGQLRLELGNVSGAKADYQEIIQRGNPKTDGEYMFRAGSQLRFLK